MTPWDATPSWPELLAGAGGGVASAGPPMPRSRAPRHGRNRSDEPSAVDVPAQISWPQALSWSVLVALGVLLVLRTG